MSQVVVFVALGSRGDVQPLAVLASRLAHHSPLWKKQRDGTTEFPTIRVVLATHAELETPLRAAVLPQEVEFRALPMPCFLAKQDEANDNATCALPCVLDLGGQRRAEWVAAVNTAKDATLLIGNLFALAVVYHLAERLGVNWLCASPCLVPYAAPKAFANEFNESFPELRRALDAGQIAGLSWADIDSWLWPLFTDNHALLREELLGLPPVPGYNDCDHLEPTMIRMGRFLLGIPHLLLEEAGGRGMAGLPSKAIVCGSWLPCIHDSRLPKPVEDYLCSCGQNHPIYFGFGSMGAAGLVPQASSVLKVIVDTARWMRRGAIVMANLIQGHSSDSSDKPFELTPDTRTDSSAGDDAYTCVLLCHEEVGHDILFRRCSVVVHHGGIGTVLAASQAGVPQLIIPLAFDQPYWGQRIQDLRVGEVIALEELTVLKLSKTLRHLIHNEQINRTAADLGHRLRAVDGVQAAIHVISDVLSATDVQTTASVDQPLKPVRRVPLHASNEAPLVWARCAGEVRYIRQEIADRKCYGDLQNLPGDSIVIDAGMNLGLFAMHLADMSKDEGNARSSRRIVCIGFEPAAETYALAVRNLREQGISVVEHGTSLGGLTAQVLPARGHDGNEGDDGCRGICVHCVQMALGADDGHAELCYFPHMMSNSALQRHRAGKDKLRAAGVYDSRLREFFFAEERLERVRCVSLRTVMNRIYGGSSEIHTDVPISLLKVDVEGAEVDVMKGVGEEHWPRVQRVAAEIHSKEALLSLQELLCSRFPKGVHTEAHDDLPEHWMLYAERGDVKNGIFKVEFTDVDPKGPAPKIPRRSTLSKSDDLRRASWTL